MTKSCGFSASARLATGMTKKKRKVVGRYDKLAAIRDLLNCGIVEPGPLVPGVPVVVDSLLEVPRGVVVLLAGEDRFWEKGEDPVANW